jgi:mono/diheme cytochrome c family protein
LNVVFSSDLRKEFNQINMGMRNCCSSIAVALASAAAVFSMQANPADEYRDRIRPILQKHCFSCHGDESTKADLNLAYFAEYDMVLETREVWQHVFERVQAFEMPPRNSPELGFNEHQTLMRWLRALPSPPKPDCDQLASDRNTSFYAGYVMSRRLNRAEYNNTVRDLIGVELHLEELLPADGGGGEGFDTAGSALFTSTIHIEKYLAAADRIVTTVLPDNANDLSPELAKARARILIALPDENISPREAARKIVAEFSRRAFRRPVPVDEVERLLTMFERGWERGDGFVPSVRLALKAVLISPNFLFLAEPEPEQGGIHRLGPFPLASRLSYFIWSSMPDEELFSLAQNGLLLDDKVYRQQIRRLLADPKAQALGDRFALQWLDMDGLGTEVVPDPKRFPEFDPELNASMRREVMTFFNHLFREDRSLLELIDSDYTFVNARLARLYGLDDIGGSELQWTRLPDRNRGGIVGMAAVHTLTSYPLRTSPVLRGRWVLEVLLGEKVPLPPPDVPALEEHSEESAEVSLRRQLELHRTKAECAACHDKMDPLGFALENFDVLGRWREMDRGLPIDAEGQFGSGDSFTGPGGLKDVLMKRKDQVMRNLVRKMAGFAYGRELNRFDNCVIDRTMEALQGNQYRAVVLVEQIATSFPFQHRFYPKQN